MFSNFNLLFRRIIMLTELRVRVINPKSQRFIGVAALILSPIAFSGIHGSGVRGIHGSGVRVADDASVAGIHGSGVRGFMAVEFAKYQPQRPPGFMEVEFG